jgi:hypothetical protein
MPTALKNPAAQTPQGTQHPYRRGAHSIDLRTAQRSSAGALFALPAPPARYQLLEALESKGYPGRTAYP